MTAIKALAETLVSVTHPGMKPKEIIASVREQHPKASKKEIVRAAFYSLTETSPEPDDKAKHLHDFALTERGAEEEGGAKVFKLKKKSKKKDHEVSSSHPLACV